MARYREHKVLLDEGLKQLPLTADKREIKDFPILPSATSFIRKTLGGGVYEFRLSWTAVITY
jgi:hypothetical protein